MCLGVWEKAKGVSLAVVEMEKNAGFLFCFSFFA